MIVTNRKITIGIDKSTIDEPVVLYRGDHEVEIRFTLDDSKFKFLSGVNVIETDKPSYAQLAILRPDADNIFSDITRCSEGIVSFVLTKAMIDQINEVGVYSFHIRLFDYNKSSRVTIPPVEYGIEVREPIASEDRTNYINEAKVGYSIVKASSLDNDVTGPTFDSNGNYNRTNWKNGDRITDDKLNKIEGATQVVNQNEIMNKEILGRKMDSNYNILNSIKVDKDHIWSMRNMGQDVKEAMTGGSVAVVGKDTILTDNIRDNQINNNKLKDDSIDGRVIIDDIFNYNTPFVSYNLTPKIDRLSPICLITIPNIFGDISSNDIVRITFLANGYNNPNNLIITGIGMGTTRYSDHSDYNNSRIDNYTQGSVIDHNNILNTTKTVKGSVTMTTNITSSTPYLVIGFNLKCSNVEDYNVSAYNIKMALNDGEYISIDNIITAGMFGRGVTVTENKCVYGKNLNTNKKNKKNNYQLVKNIAHKYGLDKAFYTKYKCRNTGRSTSLWTLFTIPNTFGTLENGDVMYINADIINISNRNLVFTACLCSSNFDDFTDYHRPLDNLTTKPNNNTTKKIMSGVKYNNTFDISVKESMNNQPYIIIGIRATDTVVKNIEEYLIANLKVKINETEYVDVDPICYNMWTYEDDIHLYRDITEVVKLEDLNEYNKLKNNITLNDIDGNVYNSRNKYNISTSITNSNQTDTWLLFTLDETYIDNDGVISFRSKLKSENIKVNDGEICVGYTNHRDSTDYTQSPIPGYLKYTGTNHGDFAIQYNNDILSISFTTRLLRTEFLDYKYLIVGVKLFNDDTKNSTVRPVSVSYSVENIDVLYPGEKTFIYANTHLVNSINTMNKEISDDIVLLTNKNLYEYHRNIDLNDISGKKISILGDSISTFAGWIPTGNAVYYHGNNCGVTNVNQTWWKRVIDKLNLELCVNNSWSGSRMTTIGGVNQAGCMNRCESLHTSTSEPDIIIIYLGTNDYHSVSLGLYDGTQTFPTDTTKFREAYAICLKKVLTRYPNAKVYTSTLICGERVSTVEFPEKNSNNELVKKWNDSIREISDLFGVPVIEMHKCGITYQNANVTMGDFDGQKRFLHPNALGMEYMSEKVIKSLLYL